jgi:hypothetical protein
VSVTALKVKVPEKVPPSSKVPSLRVQSMIVGGLTAQADEAAPSTAKAAAPAANFTANVTLRPH